MKYTFKDLVYVGAKMSSGYKTTVKKAEYVLILKGEDGSIFTKDIIKDVKRVNGWKNLHSRRKKELYYRLKSMEFEVDEYFGIKNLDEILNLSMSTKAKQLNFLDLPSDNNEIKEEKEKIKARFLNLKYSEAEMTYDHQVKKHPTLEIIHDSNEFGIKSQDIILEFRIQNKLQRVSKKSRKELREKLTNQRYIILEDDGKIKDLMDLIRVR